MRGVIFFILHFRTEKFVGRFVLIIFVFQFVLSELVGISSY